MNKKLVLIVMLVAVFTVIMLPCEAKRKRISSIVMKNERSLKKSIADNEQCSYPQVKCQKNIVTYTKENKDGHTDIIRINTKSMVEKFGTPEHKKAMEAFKPLVNKGVKVYNFTQSPVVARLFDDCLDYGCPIIMDLGPINYPGVDKARAVCTMDTQSYIGDLTVRIFGYKKNNFVQISGDSGVNPDKYSKVCTAYYGNNLTKCFISKVRSDSMMKIQLRNKADELMRIFATPDKRVREPNGIYIIK